jgi:hypothetical protein
VRGCASAQVAGGDGRVGGRGVFFVSIARLPRWRLRCGGLPLSWLNLRPLGRLLLEPHLLFERLLCFGGGPLWQRHGLLLGRVRRRCLRLLRVGLRLRHERGLLPGAMPGRRDLRLPRSGGRWLVRLHFHRAVRWGPDLPVQRVAWGHGDRTRREWVDLFSLARQPHRHRNGGVRRLDRQRRGLCLWTHGKSADRHELDVALRLRLQLAYGDSPAGRHPQRPPCECPGAGAAQRELPVVGRAVGKKFSGRLLRRALTGVGLSS